MPNLCGYEDAALFFNEGYGTCDYECDEPYQWNPETEECELPPPPSGNVYSDYDRYDYWFLGYIHSYWELYLTVDTRIDKITLKTIEVEGIIGNQINPLNTYVKVWDKDGIIFQYGPNMYPPIREGQWTVSYSKNYRWVYAEVIGAIGIGFLV